MRHRSKGVLFVAAALTIALVATPTLATASSESTVVAPKAPSIAAGTFVADTWVSAAGPFVHRVGGVTPNAQFTWGWITGTIYFNKRETNLIAAFGGMAGYLASLIGPWGVLIGSHLGSITAVASFASSSSRCLKIKIPAMTPVTYSGGYCR